MKILKWFSNNILFLSTLFLLVFIPLYPKLPIININHTWVYIRAEDFLVSIIFLLWITLMFLRKVTFKTPLTMPIILFWLVGALATIHGILLIFPTITNVFPNVAFLNYIRRIEYISLFFVAYSAIKDKRFIPYIVGILAITLLSVSIYGIGQKYLGFPAFLTMNEEFAKGIPIRLSALSRVSSTFGGHYDLAAYLVLVIPILSSMILVFRNWFAKFFLLITVSLGLVVLSMTVSRISFIVLLFSLILMLILHKKRLAILGIISLFVVVLLFLSFSTSLLQRYSNSVKESDVLVDARGQAVGNIKEVSSQDFKDKVIKIKFANSKREVDASIGSIQENIATSGATSLVILPADLPPTVPLMFQPNAPTGENLPSGTGYVNLPLTPVAQKIKRFFYVKTNDQDHSQEVMAIYGKFLVKKAVSYDLSFTTRFQGEWPKAMAIFRKDILFGGGYSSTGLAVDNNYFRILGEVGLLGFISFFSIFLMAGVYIKRLLPQVDSPVVKGFVYGFISGAFGLILNAIFIDVFEASKIAFTFWLLLGATIGILSFYQKKDMDLVSEFKKVMTSTLAIVIYLLVSVIVIFGGILNYFFAADDFIWIHWAADNGSLGKHLSIFTTILNYFTNADGFFYRPGTKIYFLFMYSGFWVNQSAYHLVSILLHFTVAVLIFLLSRKILKSFPLSVFAAFLFIILSGYTEAVFWISATGHLFNAVFILLSLLLFIIWREKKKKIYLALSLVSVVLSLMFHELGMVAPLIMVLYSFVFEENLKIKSLFKKTHYAFLFIPLLPYLALRFFSGSHWFNGDYSYNILKLPFNFIGNALGYFMLTIFGSSTLVVYEKIRNASRENMIISSMITIGVILITVFISRIIIKKMQEEEKKVVIFGFLFFIVSLLPFLGLGNITFRYSYLASFGLIILFVFFLKKLFIYMNRLNGRNIAVSSLLLIVTIFSFIHIIQFQKTLDDWLNSGKKVQSFIISLDQNYEDSWKTDSMNFYFVNVPIKWGDAWIFPVGLKDAVWFVSRNPNIHVFQIQSVDDALNMVKDPLHDKVFVIDESGGFTEKEKSFVPLLQ